MIRTAIVTLALLALAGCGAASAPTQTSLRSSERPKESESISSATPGAVASVAPTATIVPTATAALPHAQLLGAADKGRPLAPGTYRVAAPFTKPFTLTFGGAWSLDTLTPGGVQFHYVEGGGHPAAPYLIIDVVDNVFTDICQASAGELDPPVEHTAQAVVAALGNMTGVKAGQVENVDVNGRPAMKVQMTNTVSPEDTRCVGTGLLWLWTNSSGAKSPGTNAQSTEHIWAFDIGSDVVLVDGETYPPTAAADIEVVQAVPPTITFD